MADKILQLKRNATVFGTKSEALTGLQGVLATSKAGEPVIATYSEDGAVKIILGISNGDGNYTIFDNTESDTALTETINSLDLADAAVAKSFVTQVTQTDGQIEVSRGAITSNGKTVLLGDGSDGGINLDVNVDGTTIVSTDGVLGVASSALTQYVGSEAIAISDVDAESNTKTVSLTINTNDKVLTQSANGLLTNINLTWDKTNGLKLIGKDNTEIATIPATDFIKDGMLESVTLEVNPSGQDEGTYLHFVFNTDAEKSDIYVNVTSLIDIYTGQNGVTVSNYTISGVVDPDSESFLTVGAAGFKVSGVQEAITNAVNALDVAATAKSDEKSYVTTTISQTDGKVSNDSVAVVYGDYADGDAQVSGIATTEATKAYVDAQVAAKNVDAEGDDYVAATAANNKVTVATNVSNLTVATPDSSDSTLSGTANSLADGADIASKVSQFVNLRVGEEIAKLDATVGATEVTTGSHVAVQVVETDGVLTGVTVTENDIASSSKVGEDQLPEGKTVMDVILENEETAATAINKLATAAGLLGGDEIAYTAPTVSGAFTSTTSIMDMLNVIDANWNTFDCGTY